LKRLLISAFGINSGGGLVLLKALVGSAHGRVRQIELDGRVSREQIGAAGDVEIRSVRRSFLARFVSSIRLANAARPGDVLLCFNSLPPLLRSPAKVVTYVHAPHFVGGHLGIRYTFITSVRLALERTWFRFAIRNADEAWVQTPTMASMLSALYPALKVRIVPLLDDTLYDMVTSAPRPPAPTREQAAADDPVFFYPADTVGHKNHANLLRAWALLQESGCDARLWLTIDQAELETVLSQIAIPRTAVSNVEPLGRLTRQDVLTRMTDASALIFPSTAETFGLPMIEARALGKPIIASERDFVRDVCYPAQSFDPISPRSIARAVLRYAEGEKKALGPYYAPDQFLAALLS
jgi:glycosyltransferase involved in cell wall biosynthesis